MVTEIIIYVMMIALIAAGAFLLYEGVTYIEMKQKNNEIPNTIYAAATFAFLVGIMDILFGIAHYWFIPGNTPPAFASKFFANFISDSGKGK